MEENKRICPSCGIEVDAGEKYCRVCGMGIGDGDDVVVVRKESSMLSFWCKLRLAPSNIIARNAVLLILSLVVLISAFLPIISLNGVEISPVQSVVLATDLIRTQSEEDLKESKLGEQVWDFFMSDDMPDVNIGNSEIALHDYYPEDIEDSELSHFAYLMVRYIFRNASGGPVAIMCVAAVLCILHIILSLALFIRAFKNFVRLASGKKTLYRQIISQFCFMLPFYLVTYFAVSNIGFFSKAVAIGFLLTVIALAVGVVYAAVELGISKYRQGKEVVAERKLIALALSIVLICMIFVPLISLSVEGVYAGRSEEKTVTVPLDIALFSELSPMDNEAEVYDYLYLDEMAASDALEYTQDELYEMTVRDVKEEKDGQALFARLLTIAYFANYETEFAYKFSFIPLLSVLAGLAAVFVVWQRLKNICLDSISAKTVFAFNIVGTGISVCLLVFVVIFVSTSVYAMKYMDIEKVVSCGVAAGAIALLVAFAVNLFTPTKRIVFVEREADRKTEE